MDELTQELANEKVLVTRGYCAPGAAQGLPLAPIREVAQALSRALGPRLGRLVSPDDRAVTALLADLAAATPAEDVVVVKSQAQLFDGVAHLLRDIARPRRLAVVVEDVHWADETSRDFLEFLGRSLRDEQLLLIVTARTDDPAYESCRPLIADLTGLRHGTRIELARLTEDQVRNQVANLRSEHGPDAPELARIVALTEGVPLLVEEALDADLDDVGALADVLVGHRINRLSPAARTVAETAAGRRAGTDARPARRRGPPSPRAGRRRLRRGGRGRRAAPAPWQGRVPPRTAARGDPGAAAAEQGEDTAPSVGPESSVTSRRARRPRSPPPTTGERRAIWAALSRRTSRPRGTRTRISAYAEETQMFRQAAELWPSVPDAGVP